MDKKFIISGAPENEDIIEEKPNRSGTPKGIEDLLQKLTRNRSNLSPENQNDSDNLTEALNMFSKMIVEGSDPEFLKEMEKHMEDTGNENRKSFAIDPAGLDKVLEYFSNPVNSVAGDFLNMFENISEEIEKEEDEYLNPSSYQAIANGESFKMIPYKRDPYIYERLQKEYGKEDIFPMEIFDRKNMLGYNLIPGLSEVEYFDYIEHDEKYVILKAIPTDPKMESFIVSVILAPNGSLEMVVPEYGNTYLLLSGEAYDKEIDSHLYNEIEDEKGKIELKLKVPVDIDKIKAGLDVLLYEENKPILSPFKFGKIEYEESTAKFSSNHLRIGKIRSNEFKESQEFKDDFGINPDQILFDFYFKLPKEYNGKTLTSLNHFFSNVDLNDNPGIASKELKKDPNDNLYIEIELGDFPEFIEQWKNE